MSEQRNARFLRTEWADPKTRSGRALVAYAEDHGLGPDPFRGFALSIEHETRQRIRDLLNEAGLNPGPVAIVLDAEAAPASKDTPS